MEAAGPLRNWVKCFCGPRRGKRSESCRIIMKTNLNEVLGGVAEALLTPKCHAKIYTSPLSERALEVDTHAHETHC